MLSAACSAQSLAAPRGGAPRVRRRRAVCAQPSRREVHAAPLALALALLAQPVLAASPGLAAVPLDLPLDIPTRVENDIQILGEARRDAETRAREEAVEKNRLCVTPLGIDVVGITEAVLAVGAFVGGAAANGRKKQVAKLNAQLRKVNEGLRRQARRETYAPGLRYAPPTAIVSEGIASPDVASLSASLAAPSVEHPPDGLPLSTARTALREGRRHLKSDEHCSLGTALVHFEKALLLTKNSGDKVLERRAVRGLAVAKRGLGEPKAAISMFQRVLELGDEMGASGQLEQCDVDALGSIADLYTEIGELENASRYYDKYIAEVGRELVEASANGGAL